MTVKLNLTIDKEVVAKTKKFAARKKTTVSKMVQEFLRKQLTIEEGKKMKTGFITKHAGILSGKLSDKKVKKITANRLSEKYGY